LNHFLKVEEVVCFSIGTEVNLHTDSIMAEKTITFNDVPEAMTYLIEKFDRLENLIESAVSPKTDELQWLGYRCPLRISPRQAGQTDSLRMGMQENHPLPQKRKKAAVPEK